MSVYGSINFQLLITLSPLFFPFLLFLLLQRAREFGDKNEMSNQMSGMAPQQPRRSIASPFFPLPLSPPLLTATTEREEKKARRSSISGTISLHSHPAPLSPPFPFPFPFPPLSLHGTMIGFSFRILVDADFDRLEEEPARSARRLPLVLPFLSSSFFFSFPLPLRFRWGKRKEKQKW